uniref:Putative MhmaT1 transposase n=1 Tax=Arbanitis rapax TaxID=196123 RepID=G3G3K1_ARBRA|nr:putative MhmaT1 transposase [Misgolas hubbardi]
MEWSAYENRVAVIALHKVGKSSSEIFNLLQQLQISRMFVYRTIKRFVESGNSYDLPRKGRSSTVRTARVVKAVASRIRRNPVRSQAVMDRELNISRVSMSRVLRSNLGLRAYRRRTGHFLTPQLMQQRVLKARRLLKRFAHNHHRQILFSDEKIFTIEESFNSQNDRVYASTSQEAQDIAPRIMRGHYPASVMVWWGVSYEGATELHFCEKGVKTSAKVYQDTVLEPVVENVNHTLFQHQQWSFQQDSAPAHKARSTQEWLRSNVPDFITPSDWPSSSPDLNPLDYKLWAILESKVCRKRHPNIDSLKRSLVRAAAAFPVETIRNSIDAWPERL